MKTRTGHFPIGFRRMGAAWQKDLRHLAEWARSAGFESIDLGKATAEDAATLKSAGSRLGSVDLLNFGELLAEDPSKRKELIDANVEYVKQVAEFGAKAFFTVILPGNPDLKRADNYALAVDSYRPIVQAIEQVGGHLVIEGWPGRVPHLPALCCTPETYRRFIQDLGPKAVGINYDPSHLIRLGVDHIRFLHEFVTHVFHVHAKDTELDAEAQYEYGLYQQAAFTTPIRFGASTWRYTIPGHGQTRWGEVFNILRANNYAGLVSVELEDNNFNGSESGEQAGLTLSLAFLAGT